MRRSSNVAAKIIITTVSAAFVLLTASASMQSKALGSTDFAPANLADAAQLFNQTCARCHGTDGRAQTPKGKQKGATDFTSSKWKPNDARMFKAIKDGKGQMPAFGETISDDEIRSLVGYIKNFKK